jgi:membrane protein DedA with SNARE-associated domain
MGTLAAVGGVLAALLAAGVGVPLPEDVTLLGAGYLAWRGQAPLWLMILVGFVGIVAGDTMLYWIGRALGAGLERGRGLGRRLRAHTSRIREFFARHGSKAVLLARFAAGARGAFYLTAGATRMSYPRFVLFDGLAACVSATVWVCVGWRFGAHIDRAREVMRHTEHRIALAVICVIVLTLFIRRQLARQ